MACIGLLGHFWDPYPGSGNPEFFLYYVTGFVVLGMLCGARDVLCFCHCWSNLLGIEGFSGHVECWELFPLTVKWRYLFFLSTEIHEKCISVAECYDYRLKIIITVHKDSAMQVLFIKKWKVSSQPMSEFTWTESGWARRLLNLYGRKALWGARICPPPVGRLGAWSQCKQIAKRKS